MTKNPVLAANNKCTGCMACYNACNNNAIIINKDDEGFLQPKILADKCIICGLCEKSCPVVTANVLCGTSAPKTYAGWHNEDRCLSSSGGAFSAFARKTIEKRGYVYGAKFDENMQCRHVEIANIDGLDALRGSKYMQSFIGDTFKQVKRRLQEDKPVLFCGTPCQVAGLKNYLRKNYENLLTLDLACHGVPSQDIFDAYLKKLCDISTTRKCNTKVDGFEFRRRDGWGYLPAVSIDGNRKSVYGVDSLFLEAFNKSAIFRKSCYSCTYSKIPRIGDITLADFWGIGRNGIPFKHDVMKGVSLILANNEKGLKAVNELDDDTFIVERTLKEALVENHNLRESSPMHPQREAIIRDFLDERVTLREIDHRYHLVDHSLKGTIKRWSSKTGLFGVFKRVYNKYKTL